MISGIKGLDEWPSMNTVVNVEPSSAVIVSSFPKENFFAINVLEHNAIVETFTVIQDDRIVLPQEIFSDAFSRHVTLQLIRDSDQYLGRISFLPVADNVPFVPGHRLDDGGIERASNNFATTDFVSVEDVTDIVISAFTRSGTTILCGYDSERQFVKVILNAGTYDNVHVEPDGTYSLVRACSILTYDYSLELHYRRRR